MDWIVKLRHCFDADTVYYTQHAKAEMENEEFGPILDAEIYEAICVGEVLEAYSGDEPYPSALILGLTGEGRPLHVVCAYNQEEDTAIVITSYHPDPQRWIDNRTRRTT